MKHLLELPDKSMPTAVIEIVSYLDEAGAQKWSWRIDGGPPVMQAIGMLESLEQVLVHQVLGSLSPEA